MTPKEAAQQWKDRWSARTRGDASAVRGIDDDEMEAAIATEDKESIVNDSTAGEFGATVHANGTRSFLNGWYVMPPISPCSVHRT